MMNFDDVNVLPVAKDHSTHEGCNIGMPPSRPATHEGCDIGMSPSQPVVVNENGGKQSMSPYAFHMLPAAAVMAAARVAKEGADKYGETFDNRNYTKISAIEHVNHAIAHLYAYLLGDTSDDHLSHAIVRTLFAYDVAKAM